MTAKETAELMAVMQQLINYTFLKTREGIAEETECASSLLQSVQSRNGQKI